jgi:3-hydroxymyristoyl/3-hydroxydecanoyl-(acyl carrier protein) dehydratase
MATAGLPHEYPFRFVDAVSPETGAELAPGDRRVRVRVSANAWGAQGEAWRSPLLFAEAVAQSALLLEGGDADSARTGFLAGLEGFAFTRSPRAGETLEIRVRLAARFGAVARFDGEVHSLDEPDADAIAKGAVLVRKGGTPSVSAEPGGTAS